MLRFSANLSFLFRELPFLDRFQAASAAGFKAVEVLFPYDDSVGSLTQRLNTHGLEMVLINTPPPNWAGGDRGFAAIPGGQARFRHDFTRALRFARALKSRHLHVMAGNARGLVAHQTFVENLKWAAAQSPAQSLTIEPINPHDMPGYFLNDFDMAAEVIDNVGAKNLGLQFDAYHAQMISGDMHATWEKHASCVRHIQISGFPDRKEPLAGDIDYPAFFRMLDQIGYTGHVSAEYHPTAQTEAGLTWMHEALAGS